MKNIIIQLDAGRNLSLRSAVKADIPMISDAWLQAYPNEFPFKFPHRWKWQFESNPFLNIDRDYQLPIWIALDQDQVIGWSCAMLVRAKAIDQEVSLAFGTDMHVKTEFRRKNLGLKLQQENQNNHAMFMSIQMSEGSRRIKLKIGGKHGNPLKIYIKLYRQLEHELLYTSLTTNPKYSNYLKYFRLLHKIFSGFEFRVISHILSFLIKHKQLRDASSKTIFTTNRRYHFEKIDIFGEEADQFWDKIKVLYGFSVIRDKEYLNWKYVKQPYLRYEKFYLKEENQIVGLVIFRLGKPPEIKVGVITEIMAINNDPSLFKELLLFADHTLRSMGAYLIRCGSSINKLDYVLENAGYQLLEFKVPVLNINTDSITANHDEIINSQWLLSLGDQDLDIPLLNQQPPMGHLIGLLRGKIPGHQLLRTAR